MLHCRETLNLFGVLAVAASAALIVGASSASAINTSNTCASNPCTLDELINGGELINLNGTILDSWGGFSSTGSTSIGAAELGMIDAVEFHDPVTGQIGLNFIASSDLVLDVTNGTGNAAGTEDMTFLFDFDITTPLVPFMKGSLILYYCLSDSRRFHLFLLRKLWEHLPQR